MDKAKIERINFLARKAKSTPLTDEEKAEQAALRTEYREQMKRNFINELSNTYVVDENGNKRRVIK